MMVKFESFPPALGDVHLISCLHGRGGVCLLLLGINGETEKQSVFVQEKGAFYSKYREST